MMNEWFTQFVRTNPAAQQPPPPLNPQTVLVAPQVVELQRLNKPPVGKMRKYRAKEIRAVVDDDPKKAKLWLEKYYLSIQSIVVHGRWVFKRRERELPGNSFIGVPEEIYKSGCMTVTEYEREFVRLSKYAGEYVSTE
ncbi:Gag-Pol polyprotein [Gossypium australe]|uniref:Gag-Pol polyprotein n=1 Tax=Gossypium australe TaxID=47621 RepID=A0A5B6W6T3_9ROSI|nr:Gag-Pol polyprotein [Gossypium australe]